jgi:hypothetical protein
MQCNAHQNSSDTEYKEQAVLFTEVEVTVLNFIWKHKRRAKAILSKGSNAGGITIADCKLDPRAIVTETAWPWHRNRHKD